MHYMVLTLALAALPSTPAHAASIRVADGDSFEMAGQRYRLHDVDAPELHQNCSDAAGRAWPCGRRARSELRRLIGSQPVACRSVARDRYGRIVAICIAGGRDLGDAMVRSGYATASSGFGSASRYDAVEIEARRERRGLWAGSFERPRQWRQSHPRDDSQAQVAHPPHDWLSRQVARLRETLARWFPAAPRQ